MSIEVRKAKPDDALAIQTIALSRSRTTRLQDGISDRQLEREGFLVFSYPVDRYRKRIEESDHFWVAENAGEVVAYTMAYTFREWRSFTNLSQNDHTFLMYFESWGCSPDCVYIAQAATTRGHEARGAMAALGVCLPKHASERGAPAILCDIVLNPRNRSSIASVTRSGFRMVATRTHIDITNGENHFFGTYMRTLGGMLPR